MWCQRGTLTLIWQPEKFVEVPLVVEGIKTEVVVVI